MNDDERRTLSQGGASVASRAQGLVFKLIAAAASAVLLVSAIAASLVLFVIAAAVLVVFGAYFWWRTRELRRQLRAQREASSVLEGEFVDVTPEAQRVRSRQAPAQNHLEP